MSVLTKPLLPQRADEWIVLIMFMAILGFSVLCGMIIPRMGILVPALVGAMMLSIVVLALSPRAIVWLMLVLVLLVVGQLTFFLGIQQANWLPYLLLLLVAVKFLLEKLRVVKPVATGLSISPISILIVLFCLFFCLSALINKTDLASFGVAAKNYIFPWFLTALIVSAIPQTDEFQSIWKFLLWIVPVQVPFAIPQYFYFARRSGASWDAIVGTFGGNFLTGGGSGTMAIFLVFGIILALSLFRERQIDGKMLALVVLTALATVALAEVKIFFFCIPVALVLLFRSRILVNPIKSLALGLCGALLLGSVILVYQKTYSQAMNNVNDVQGLIDYVFIAESNPDSFNRETGELSRTSAILMWKRYNSPKDYAYYIGHGPASSRESKTLGTGVAARRYPFTLTTSTASTLLWDLGLLGYALFLGLLSVAGIAALRLAHRAPPMETAVLNSLGVMLLLNLPLSIYNRDLVDSATAQVLLAFWIGYILLYRKNASLSTKTHYRVLRRTL